LSRVDDSNRRVNSGSSKYGRAGTGSGSPADTADGIDPLILKPTVLVPTKELADVLARDIELLTDNRHLLPFRRLDMCEAR
jgi:hypothetical protein